MSTENILVEDTLDEDLLRRTQAATIIAQSLHYVPESSETPTEIINHALSTIDVLTLEQKSIISQMLHLAESMDVEHDKSLFYYERR